MNILSICDSPDILKVMRIIILIINILKAVVPIVLILVLMIRFTSAVTKGKEDVLESIKKSAPVNIIAAVLIFLVPTFVSIVTKISFPNSDYSKCLYGISNETIAASYESREEKLVIKAEESLNINDYTNAMNYLLNIENVEKKEEFTRRLEAVKEKIDSNSNIPTNPETSTLVSSGLGRDIVPTEELITTCKWVINQELVNIRLQTCPTGDKRYDNADEELPGGATHGTDRDVAKETIPLSEYSKGVFFGEEKIEVAPDSRYAFIIIYRTVILKNTVHYAISAKRNPLDGAEIRYTAGNCAQNYRNSLRKDRYDSGKYKVEIDDAQNTTKYLVLANANGEVTNAQYRSYTGIEQQIEAAGKSGKNYIEILENVIKSGNDNAASYKTARIYDCRNLYETGEVEYLVK